VSGRESVRFFSDGHRLDGEFWLPRSGRSSVVIIPCSGYLGLKALQPARFARALTPRGYACLTFDYRGFGFSDGERGRLVPTEQVDDIRAAVDYASSRPGGERRTVVLLGWGLGGALVIAEAADDHRVAAVVSLNGFADGYRTTRALHDDASWAALVDRLDRDRLQRLRHGRSGLLPAFDLVRLHGSTRCLPAESNRLYELAGEPRELHLLEGAGHSECMHDGHETFKRLVGMIDGFIQRALALDECVDESVASA
jgi:uncharacterized protein